MRRRNMQNIESEMYKYVDAKELEQPWNPFLCEECGTTFKNTAGLKRHQTVKHGDTFRTD